MPPSLLKKFISTLKCINSSYQMAYAQQGLLGGIPRTVESSHLFIFHKEHSECLVVEAAGSLITLSQISALSYLCRV